MSSLLEALGLDLAQDSAFSHLLVEKFRILLVVEIALMTACFRARATLGSFPLLLGAIKYEVLMSTSLISICLLGEVYVVVSLSIQELPVRKIASVVRSGRTFVIYFSSTWSLGANLRALTEASLLFDW